VTSTSAPKHQRRVTVVAVLIGFGFFIVLASLSGILAWSIPHLRAGTVPDEPYARNYVLHPWPAALHIVPGLIYLFGAPLQLSARFRRKHLTLHRRLGRVVIVSGIVAAVFALVVGLSHPYDGAVEASATVVFGGWFLTCLVRAFVAVRRRKIADHRRWMIRAFATGIGIAAIRVWIGILGAIQSAMTDTVAMSPQHGTYGAAFWLGFGSTALAGEWWLRRPAAPRPAAKPA
jgi:uncharacterized membrane protein